MGSVNIYVKWLLVQIWQVICVLLGARIYEHTDDMCDSLLERGVVTGERELKHLLRQQVIEKFHPQRKSGSQFAVFMLLDGRKSGYRLTFKPCDSDRKPLCDSNHIFYPSPTEYVNYIVSRPSIKPNRIVKFLYLAVARSHHYQTHAEEVIFPEVGTLVERFKMENHSCPNTIILFSWLFPCTVCTDLIIENLSGAGFRQQYPTIQNIILAYKSYWKRVSKDENEKNVVRLRQEGFKLVRVEYAKQLPSVECVNDVQ